MVKIYDVAERAGVSPATVSNALNKKGKVSNETRVRVLKACKELGYAPAHKKPRIHDNNIIVFNFSDFDRSFYLNIIKGISECLNENNHDLIICTNRSGPKFMRKQFSAGAISLDRKMSNEQLLTVAHEEYPVVVMDRVIDHRYIKSVIMDNFPVMCELVEQLVHKGYRRFGYIGGEDTLDNYERYRAFAQTLDANGIYFDKKQYYHGDYREKGGFNAARLMLLGNVLPQVIVCANDHMAFGVLRALKERGLEAPRDIGVTGFDDSDAARIMGLTTVSIPRYENGYLAAKELLAMLEGAEAAEPLRIRGEIRWRGTTWV